MRGGFVGVAGWLKNTLIDFPGTVSAVLFYSGCNLRCPYCHNPGIVLGDNRENGKAESHPLLADQIGSFLEKRKGKIEGIVLSGGEPTMHATIVDDTAMIRKLGYRIKLDTNGLLPGMIQQIAPDYLAVDVKTLPALYPVLLASPYGDVERRLKDTLRIAKSMGRNAEVRITVSPGIVDRTIIMQMGELVQGMTNLFLQPMQQKNNLLDPSWKTKELIPAEEIAAYRDILSEYVDRCVVRGANDEVGTPRMGML